MIKRELILLIASLTFNLLAQQDSTDNIDSGTISEEVVSSIEADTTLNNIDSTSEELLDSLYNSEEEELAIIESPSIENDAKSEVTPSRLSKEVVESDNDEKDSFEKHKNGTPISIMPTMKGVIKSISRYLLQVVIFLFSFGLLIFVILRFIKRIENSRFLTSTRLSLMDKEVQIACRYMESNYSDTELTVEKLCKELVTGAAFLEALFVKELGMGIEDFLKQVRINRARKALEKNPQMPIYEVAEKCGYSDNDLFEKDFKSTTTLSFDDFVSTIIR